MDPAEFYRLLVEERLKDRACRACGHSLEHAALRSRNGGTTLDEFDLSEGSMVQLLAATELLTVVCVQCGASNAVGTPSAGPLKASSLTPTDEAGWSARAMEAYQEIVRARMAEGTCSACRAPLDTGVLESACGGTTLAEFDFDDEAAASILGWTQSLTVRCSRCGARVEI